MGKVRTSAAFYRRGIPDSFVGFGTVAQGNYSIVSPTYLFAANNVARPNPVPIVNPIAKSETKSNTKNKTKSKSKNKNKNKKKNKLTLSDKPI